MRSSKANQWTAVFGMMTMMVMIIMMIVVVAVMVVSTKISV
jgi:hypothetical protein